MLLSASLLLGGLGLFLLAVSMITDGLKLAGGDALKGVLRRYTSTPLRGVASGMLVTGVVQSSSAVTVATIGFVNAGFLTLAESLGVLYGANIGTTMTGWLVAVVGFDFNVEALALPLIGAGMLARLLGSSTRLGALGESVAGFGLFFIGIDVLREAFQSFAATVDLASFAPQSGVGILLHVGLGFLMTLLTQSSSAAIALTLTAASGGLLAMDAGAAMVIGANIGTTSTAVLATVGATANARRVAAAHVAFNLVTGVVALMLLPGMLWATHSVETALGLANAPAVTLALFHTVFNVLGVALMWPFTPRLAQFLAQRFVTQAETLARPLHLDRTVLVTPALAIEALNLELGRAAAIARDVVATAVNTEGRNPDSAREQLGGLRGLLDGIDDFATKLEIDRMPADLAGNLPLMLRVSNYIEDVATLAEELDSHRPDLDAITRPPVLDAIAGFQAAVLARAARCDPSAADFDPAELQAGFTELAHGWHTLKTTLLEAASRGQIPIGRLNPALEGLRTGLKMAEQLTKVALRLKALGVESDSVRRRRDGASH